MLPFGLHSAPIIFTAVAHAKEWMFRQRGVSMIDHRLDDFIIVDPPGSSICGHALDLLLSMCEDLGVPLHGTKQTRRATNRITFLNIEIDTAAGVLLLSADKLACLRGALQQWSSWRTCKKV